MARRQYRAIVVGDGILIGGMRRHVSSWFDNRADVNAWAQAIKEGNVDSGRKVASVTIEARSVK